MPIGVSKSLSTWKFQEHHVERNLDNSAIEAAHPDDTLLLAGPPRYADALTSADMNAKNSLLPLGMVQQLSWTQQKPTQPLMAIGSGRTFYTSGKATTQWSAARLFVNGRNFLRALHHNSITAGVSASGFSDPAATDPNARFFTNLDSELYYLPFGMAVLFRNKARDAMGAFYAEMCMITSWSLSVAAGQNQVMENVTGLADRMLPIAVSALVSGDGTNRDAVSAVIGFADDAAAQEANGLGAANLDTMADNVETTS